MSLLLFRLYDVAHPGLYGFVGSQENLVMFERINPETLEPTVFGTTTDSRKVLQAIADVRNEIVDSYPGLDAIQLANLAKDLVDGIDGSYAQLTASKLLLAKELEKWQPLITMFVTIQEE